MLACLARGLQRSAIGSPSWLLLLPRVQTPSSIEATAKSVVAPKRLLPAGRCLVFGSVRGSGGFRGRAAALSSEVCMRGIGRGGPAALFSTATSGGRPFVPLVQVGDGSQWLPFTTDIKQQTGTGVLKALKKDKIFRPKLAGVNLRACAVYVLTAPLPSGQQAPVAGDESGSHVVQLKGAATVKDTAGSAPFFLRVRLPDAAPPKLSSVVRECACRCMRVGRLVSAWVHGAADSLSITARHEAANLCNVQRAELFELSATDPLSIFAAAVAAAEVDETQHTITLGGGAEWRDMRSNVLFVRDFYPALWEGVLNKGRSLPFVLTGGAIIIGTPGSE